LRIAVFDYQVVPNNPIGGCHRRALERLCEEHDFTVFAAEFDNPRPDRIRHVRVPVIRRPLALLFIMFHLMAPLCYALYRLRHRPRFDLVQMVESNLAFGDICYCQFCHRSFLRDHRDALSSGGLRSRLRILDHWLHARMEPWVFRRVKRIIVPSHGLARELESEYPFTAGKIEVLSNPIDLQRMKPPADFNRDEFRRSHGIAADDLVMVFAALGHFERKGLPPLLKALAELKLPRLRLCVVGGKKGLIAQYRAKCDELQLGDRVLFAGMQKDVRPFLWSADAFILPSLYETFSLVTFEAAAAGLPVLVSRLYGVEEFLSNGENGILIGTDVAGIRSGLERLADSSIFQRAAMGERACQSVGEFGVETFAQRWKNVYAR
jgi:glycosyltransferase involved in cell wall biosynthesis